MDYGFYRSLTSWFKGFQIRVSPLPKHVTIRRTKFFQFKIIEWSKSHGWLFRFLGWLLLATAMAWLAHGSTLQRAYETWQADHHPQFRTWQKTLASYHYHSISDPKHAHRILRSLPITLDAPGSAWAHESHLWFAWFDPTRPEQTAVIFSYNNETPNTSASLSQNWVPLGKGWTAFESAIALMEADLKSREETTKPTLRKTDHEPRDPREIRF